MQLSLVLLIQEKITTHGNETSLVLATENCTWSLLCLGRPIFCLAGGRSVPSDSHCVLMCISCCTHKSQAPFSLAFYQCHSLVWKKDQWSQKNPFLLCVDSRPGTGKWGEPLTALPLPKAASLPPIAQAREQGQATGLPCGTAEKSSALHAGSGLQGGSFHPGLQCPPGGSACGAQPTRALQPFIEWGKCWAVVVP